MPGTGHGPPSSARAGRGRCRAPVGPPRPSWSARVEHPSPRLCVVSLIGEIDVSGARELRAILARTLDASPKVLVDLSQVSTIDSAGIRELLRAHAAAAKSGVVFGVVNPAPVVRRLLEITDVAQLIFNERDVLSSRR
jgi:anti-anti-sigma factor